MFQQNCAPFFMSHTTLKWLIENFHHVTTVRFPDFNLVVCYVWGFVRNETNQKPTIPRNQRRLLSWVRFPTETRMTLSGHAVISGAIFSMSLIPNLKIYKNSFRKFDFSIEYFFSYNLFSYLLLFIYVHAQTTKQADMHYQLKGKKATKIEMAVNDVRV